MKRNNRDRDDSWRGCGAWAKRLRIANFKNSENKDGKVDRYRFGYWYFGISVFAVCLAK